MKYLYVYGGAIGDTLLGLHLARMLAANKPDAVLTMLSARDNSFAKELVAEYSYASFSMLSSKSPLSWLRVLLFSFTPSKTAIFVPFQSPLSKWWKVVLRFATLHAGSIDARASIRDLHQTSSKVRIVRYNSVGDNIFDNAAKILAAWGIESKTVLTPELDRVAGGGTQSKPYIVFHFFAGSVNRSIPVDHAHNILLEARTQYPRHHFVVTCTPAEKALADRMAFGIENTEVYSGLQAHAVLALLSNAAGLVGTASGVIHMGAELKIPVIAMCNLSDPCWLPTYNKEVVILAAREHCKCNGDKSGECGIVTPEGTVFRCLYDIQTKTVIDAMKEKIAHA